MRQLKIGRSITHKEDACLERYLQEIARVPILTPDEEVILSRKVKEGDTVALEKITRANLRFVVSVAKQYQFNGLSLSDLINEGNLGLIKAAQRFDESKGFKFISYAVWWIRQSIMQSLAENSRMIRLPQNKVSMLQKVSKAFQQLEQSFEREPTSEEIAEITPFTTFEIENSMQLYKKHLSLDAPMDSEEDSCLLDLVMSQECQADVMNFDEKESLSKEIERTLQSLTERQREVIKLYFGIGLGKGMSLEDIGERFDLTRERVRQIKDRAIFKLRAANRGKRLIEYLGN